VASKAPSLAPAKEFTKVACRRHKAALGGSSSNLVLLLPKGDRQDGLAVA
jgi:hypothetical protein